MYMKRRVRFDWDEHSRTHIAAHQVEALEVEEVLGNNPVRIEIQMDPRGGEERILELGHTNAGRVLFAVWTPRGDLTVRPITAFDANRKTRAAYEWRRNEENEQRQD